MAQPIGDDTLITVRLDGEVMCTTTLGLFLVDNDDALGAGELDGLRRNLALGRRFSGGGGAAPEWSVELASFAPVGASEAGAR
jgi:hypothetical protein